MALSATNALDKIAAALAIGAKIMINKTNTPSMVAGGFASLWRLTSYPAQGAVPTTAEILSDATLGAIVLPARISGQSRFLAFWELFSSVAGAMVIIEDRLAQMGGLSGTVTTAQTVNVDVSGSTSNLTERIGAADYSEVKWWLEWYTATGAAATAVTVAVTYTDNSTGNIAVSLPATVAASRRYAIAPTNGKFIKSVQSVTLSVTTGTAGNFGVTATRDICTNATAIANTNVGGVRDWANLPIAQVFDNSCLHLSVLNAGTTSPTVIGNIQLIVVNDA